MKTAHAAMGITTEDFNALVDDLKKSLDKFKVGSKEQQDLLAILGPMEKGHRRDAVATSRTFRPDESAKQIPAIPNAACIAGATVTNSSN
jgi:hypothetical protein